MPAPYGHQQGGTRRKKNRKGKSKLGRKSRVRRGSKLMMRGGMVNAANLLRFWNGEITVERRKDISVYNKLARQSSEERENVQPIYKAKYDPATFTFTFDFSPISNINPIIRGAVVANLRKTMNATLGRVFAGDNPIPQVLKSTMGESLTRFKNVYTAKIHVKFEKPDRVKIIEIMENNNVVAIPLLDESGTRFNDEFNKVNGVDTDARESLFYSI